MANALRRRAQRADVITAGAVAPQLAAKANLPRHCPAERDERSESALAPGYERQVDRSCVDAGRMSAVFERDGAVAREEEDGGYRRSRRSEGDGRDKTRHREEVAALDAAPHAAAGAQQPDATT